MIIGGIKRPKAETKVEKAARLKREIYNRKRRWTRATDDKRRVMVAKDVLEQIAARKFEPVQRAFLIVDNRDFYKMERQDSIQGCLLDKATDCKGCAIGGAMMSMIRFNNHVFAHELDYFQDDTYSLDYTKKEDLDDCGIDGRNLSKELHALFRDSQLELIELAFEWGQGTYHNSSLSYYNSFTLEEITQMKVRRSGAMWKAYLFGRKYDNPRERLIAIMENIIANKGTFIP